ncbi:MAG: hypothetical protein LBI92_00415 [Azoarcus sp.]|nr:hypothetical protein [Azoarcus sp.]
MFVKLILIVLLIGLLVGFGIFGLILRSVFAALTHLRGDVRRAGEPSGPGWPPRAGGARPAVDGGGEAERMLACELCGVHVPESEGVRAGGGFYCCEAHRLLREGTEGS